MKQFIKKIIIHSTMSQFLVVVGAISVAIIVFAAFFSDILLTALLLSVVVLTIINMRMRFRADISEDNFRNLEKRISESIERNRKNVIAEGLKQNRNLYTQIESLLSVYKKINPQKPLPSMSGWAAPPELALLIINTIEENNYEQVVDIGSGVSSLVAGYALQENNRSKGRVVSIDHDERFYNTTKQLIKEHKLEEIVDIRKAPLLIQKVNNNSYSWYDTDQLKDIKEIDLLIVDGPPGGTQKNARFLALPLLYDKLKAGSTIILDDYFREDEKHVVEQWLKIYPELTLTEIRTDRGIALLQKP